MINFNREILDEIQEMSTSIGKVADPELQDELAGHLAKMCMFTSAEFNTLAATCKKLSDCIGEDRLAEFIDRTSDNEYAKAADVFREMLTDAQHSESVRLSRS